ncbi:hypothetical protein ES703_08469 [subsurface metagenome]
MDLKGLDIDVFSGFSHVVIGKVLVEKDWSGNFEELPDVKDFNISTTINNVIQRLCAVGFGMTALNTYDKFALHDEGASHYGWLRQGRRIKIYAGIKVSETDYHWQWITGKIDSIKFSESGGNEIVGIAGRDYMRILMETNLKCEWWGKQLTLDTVEAQETYNMPFHHNYLPDCKGVYRAFLDIDAKDGSNLVEITEGSDWTYDWDTKKFSFLDTSIPPYDGVDNLVIFYFTTQKVEEVVADILIYAGILKLWERKSWLENTDYVTPTGKTIDRVRFQKGEKCLEAIRLLIETVLYRFRFSEEGISILKPKPLESDPPVMMVNREDVEVINKGENVDEVYNQIMISGEERERIIKLLTVSTKSAEDKTANSFTAVGEIENIGSANATKRGFWLGVEHKSKDYYWEESGSFGIGEFKHPFTSLVAGKQYYFRAWALNPQGKFFGSWQGVVTDTE